MSEEIAKLGLEVDSDGFVKAKRRMDDFGKSATTAERKTKRLGRAARDAGRAVRAGMGIAAVAVAAVTANAVRMGATFESELTRMNTLVGVSREEINGFRDDILALAPAVGKSPEELAKAMFAITSAGSRGSQALEVLEASSKAAALGLGNTRDIALTAGAAVTAFGSEALTATQAVEIMVGTVEQGNLEASQLASSLGQVLSIAAASGIAFEDAGAFIASFTRQGVKASQAVTALRGALTILIREPTEKTKEAFAEMEMSVDDFKAAVENQGFIVAFQGLVDEAKKAGISMGDIIPEVEALSGVMAVFASEGESAASILGKVSAATGTLEERFQTALDQDPALAFAMIRAEFEAMSVRLGSDLLPILGVLISRLNGIDGEAGPLRQSLVGLTEIVLRLAEGSILAAGMIGELGIRLSQVAFFVDQVARNAGEQFDLWSLLSPGKGIFDQIEVIKGAISGMGPAVEGGTARIQEMRSAYGELAISAREARKALKDVGSETEKTAEVQGRLGRILGLVDQMLAQMRAGLSDLPDTQRAVVEETEDQVKATKDWEAAISDLRAELDGPLGQAMRQYQVQLQEIATDVANETLSEERAAVMLELLARQYENAAEAIRDDFIDAMDAAMASAPAFIRMLHGLSNAGQNAGSSFQNAFGRIGSGFAQSVFNGQNPVDAFSSALTGAGGQGLSDEFGQIFEGGFKSAIENLGDAETWEPSANGFMLALGQAAGGNIGQGVLTAIGNAIAGPIGAMVGSIAGELLFGESVPKFQARGTRATQATDAGADLVLGTRFGDFELAFRGLDDSQRQAVEESYTAFFGVVGDLTAGLLQDQQDRIADAVQEFGISSRSGPDSPEGQLKLLLSDIVATFPPFFGELVRAEATLDEQLARFADLLNLEGLIATGRGIPNLGFETTALLADELAMAGETLVETMTRIKSGFESLATLSLLTGNALADTSEGLARLAAGVTRAFGGDAGALSSRLDSIFEAFYSEEERFEAAVASAGDAGERLLRELLSGIDGVSFDSDMLTRGGFRELLELLTSGAFELSDQQLALLTEAGATIAGLIDAEERLAEARQNAADGLADDWLRAIENIRGALDAQLLGVSNLRPEERLNEAERQLRQAVADAQSGDLDAARAIPGLFQQAIAEGAGFFGTATAGFDAFQEDLRSLLQGLELGPDAVPVQEAQLNVLGEISEKASRQVAALEAIAGASGGAMQEFGNSEQATGLGAKNGQAGASGGIELTLEAIAARIESGNEDRRAIADEQIEQLSQLVEQLRQQTRRGMRSEIRRPDSDAARPAVVRGRNT